jgi:hypothetical protein
VGELGGDLDGELVGEVVGEIVGEMVGDGVLVGELVGDTDGELEGDPDGDLVGELVDEDETRLIISSTLAFCSSSSLTRLARSLDLRTSFSFFFFSDLRLSAFCRLYSCSSTGTCRDHDRRSTHSQWNDTTRTEQLQSRPPVTECRRTIWWK